MPLSSWMSLEAGKTTVVFCGLLCNGHIVKGILMSMESASELPWRMDETFIVCQYGANNGRHRSGVLSV